MISRRILVLIGFVPSALLFIVLNVSAIANSVGFAVKTPSGTVNIGSTFNVTLQVQTSGQSIDGAEIHVDFDPALLEVVSTAPGTLLPVQIFPASFDNIGGKIDYAAGTFSNFPKATFDLITITFKAKAAGTTTLRLPVSDIPRHSDLSFAGTSLINLTAPLDLSAITITSSSTLTATPISVGATFTPAPIEATVIPASVGTTLTVRTEAGDTALGQAVNIHLDLKQVSDLYGIDVACSVNPSILTGVQHVDGTAFKSKNSFFVDQGFQPDGHWNIAATLLKPASAFEGNGSAFNLRYRVAGIGTTAITCQAMAVNPSGFSVPLTVVNGKFSNEAVQPLSTAVVTPIPPPTVIPTLNPTLVPTFTIVPQMNTVQGVVRFQAGSDFSGIKLTLLAGGATGTILGQTVTSADGAFQFDGLAPGVYALQILGEGHMQLIKTFTVAAEGVLPLQILLRAGDTNGDQRVDLTDAALIGANFYMSVPPSPTLADLNRDGVVNVSDLALVGGNFGLEGPLNE